MIVSCENIPACWGAASTDDGPLPYTGRQCRSTGDGSSECRAGGFFWSTFEHIPRSEHAARVEHLLERAHHRDLRRAELPFQPVSLELSEPMLGSDRPAHLEREKDRPLDDCVDARQRVSVVGDE